MSQDEIDVGVALGTTVAQRDEFRRRWKSSRKALEEIREAYEVGDLDTLEDLLFMHTACTHSKVQRPKRFTGS